MPGGRPRIEVDWAAFDGLCAVQCTLAEIAAHFGVSEDTIERAVKREHGTSFADYFATKRKAGFVSLRRKQYELAMAGNATLLIFLGKQYLGQSDRRQVTTEPITFTVERIGANELLAQNSGENSGWTHPKPEALAERGERESLWPSPA